MKEGRTDLAESTGILLHCFGLDLELFKIVF